MAKVDRAPRRYFIEFNAAMILFVAAAVVRGEYAAGIANPVLKTVLIVSPIIPVLLAAWAILRFYRRIDEYHRLQMLESLAVAAGGAGVITVCWVFLEDLGLPHLSIAFAWPIIGVLWAVASVYRGFRDKASEGAAGRALRSVAVTLIYVVVGTGVYALIASRTGLSTHWAVLVLVATVLFIARMGVFIFSKTKSC